MLLFVFVCSLKREVRGRGVSMSSLMMRWRDRGNLRGGFGVCSLLVADCGQSPVVGEDRERDGSAWSSKNVAARVGVKVGVGVGTVRKACLCLGCN
jgi:hypothetical protein